MKNAYYKPTKEELAAAVNKTLPDVIDYHLRILFCGINPGLYTAAVGHHFARPGNRFWGTLFAAGYTERLLSPFEDTELLHKGFGITNLVERATNSAAEISVQEFVAGGIKLRKKIKRYQPEWVAFVGIGAYKAAFQKIHVHTGNQHESIHHAKLWLLPSTSGLNANYRPDEFVSLFRELLDVVKQKEK